MQKPKYFIALIDQYRSKQIIKRLRSIPKEEWLRIEHLFNCWIFPMEFYDIMPCWWLTKSRHKNNRDYFLIKGVCEVIRAEFTEKDTLYYHNVFNGSMSDEEFEYWHKFVHNKSGHMYYKRAVEIKKLKWWEDEVFENVCKLIK